MEGAELPTTHGIHLKGLPRGGCITKTELEDSLKLILPPSVSISHSVIPLNEDHTSRGYCFIYFEEMGMVVTAMEQLNQDGVTVCGSAVTVEGIKSKVNKGPKQPLINSRDVLQRIMHPSDSYDGKPKEDGLFRRKRYPGKPKHAPRAPSHSKPNKNQRPLFDA